MRLTYNEMQIQLLSEDLEATRKVLLNQIEENAQSIIDNNNSIMINHEYIQANNDSIAGNSQAIIDNFLSLTEDIQNQSDEFKVIVAELREDIVESQEEVIELLKTEVAALEEDIKALQLNDATLQANIDKVKADLASAEANLNSSIRSTNSYISSSVATLNTAIAAVPDVCDIDGEEYVDVRIPAWNGDILIVNSAGASSTLARYGEPTDDIDDNTGYWRIVDADGKYSSGFYRKISDLPIDQNWDWAFFCAPGGDSNSQPVGCDEDYTKWYDEEASGKNLGLLFAPAENNNTVDVELKFEWNPVTGFYRGCVTDATEVSWYVNGVEVSTNITLIQDIADVDDVYLIAAKAIINGEVQWVQHFVEKSITGKSRIRRGKVKVRRPI